MSEIWTIFLVINFLIVLFGLVSPKRLLFWDRRPNRGKVILYSSVLLSVILAGSLITENRIDQKLQDPGTIINQPALMQAHFIDVGQGDATLLRGPDFTVLIDAGRHDRDDVVPYLKSVGVTGIDLLIGTHPHADHIGQFDKVLQAFPVTEVWMSGDLHTTRTFERAIDAILASDASYHEPRRGERHQIGSLTIEVLNPEIITGDFHMGSISLRAEYGDVRFLFTGDAEKETEAEILDSGLPIRSQIFQLGHHGSSTSNSLEFLLAVSPEVAIYSAAADNSYGHPHREVVERINELGIVLYGTDHQGTIIIEADGKRFTYVE